MVNNITLDPITKKFTQIIPEAKVCYICSSGRKVDNHHYDCQEGKVSPETVPLCRRCHRTYHDLGVEWFEDEYLDKAILIENKRRSIYGQPLMKREDIKRTDYYNKTHGIKQIRENVGVQTPPFSFHLPRGEPLCGWDWVNEHLYDLMDYIPRIEVTGPGINLVSNINSEKELREVTKTLRGLKVKEHKRNDGNKKVITYDPVSKKFLEVD